MDCYYGCANASGLEIPNVEALYTELPIAVVDYAGTNIFIGQSCTFPIDFTWTEQIGTNFNRAIPYASSVAKYLKTIYSLDKLELKKIGKLGREWALNTFSPDVLGKKWQSVIDSLPELDYDYKFDFKPRNPNAIIPEIEDNCEWLKYLYFNILNMEVTNEDEGLKNWMTQLERNTLNKKEARNGIHQYFCKVALEENQKNIPLDVWTLFDINRPNKRALFLIKESRGDCIYVRALFQDFKEKFPTVDLYVMTEPQYFNMFTGDKFVHKLLPYIPAFENEMVAIGSGQEKGYVDYFYHPAILSQRHLGYLSNPL